MPESGSTEIAARIGECVAPSCAHAVIVHSAVAINASGRRTVYFLTLALNLLKQLLGLDRIGPEFDIP